MTTDETRNRIRELFPGDANKYLRNKLYATPNLLSSGPSDDEIQMAAVDAIIPATPMAPLPVEPIPAQGEVLDPEEAARRIHDAAQAMLVDAKVVIVKTAEDFIEADKGFAAIKRLIKENEEKRVSITAPLNDSLRRINEEFRKTKDVLTSELDRYERPMKAFKLAELDAQRQATADREKAIEAARVEAQAKVDEARVHLEEVHAAPIEEDPFLAALHSEDVEEARAEVRQALVEVATAPSRVIIEAPTPVKASGSKSTYKWGWEFVDENAVDRTLCEPSTRKINAYVKNLRLQVNADLTKVTQPSGIRIFEDVSLGAKG
jgi:hypothetical protein